MKFEIVLTQTALRLLQSVPDRRLREVIARAIDRLAEEPLKQGKPLRGELAGYRTLRAAGQPYRVIYRVEERRVTVVVVALGIRRDKSEQDIYAVARRLVRLRLLEHGNEPEPDAGD
jgi:mRNA interferase RelE/StbE